MQIRTRHRESRSRSTLITLTWNASVDDYVVKFIASSNNNYSKELFTEDKFANFLHTYINRASRAANRINSIAFPEQTLTLSEIYQPIELEFPFGGTISVDEILVLERAVIVDNAGMGKTTFSKFLFNEITSKTLRIPILCNLRDISDPVDVIEFARAHLDEIGAPFDHALFNALVRHGKFFFIFDGFDEVVPDLQSTVRQKLEEFCDRCGECQVLITSRHQANYPRTSGPELRFRPLSREQAIEHFLRYDKVSKSNIGARLINQIDLVPQGLLVSPLLVAILYRTFGTSGAIAADVTGFYSDVFEALYEGHDLTKAGYKRLKTSGLKKRDFRRALNSFGFDCIHSGNLSWSGDARYVEAIAKALSRISIKVYPDEYAADLRTAVPFIIRDGHELRFIHKTFAEYFAASFIVNSLRAAEILKSTARRPNWIAFAETWNYVCELSPELARNVFAVPLAEPLTREGVSGLLSPRQMCEEIFNWSFVRAPIYNHEDQRTQHYQMPSKGGNMYLTCSRKTPWIRIPTAIIDQLTEVIRVPSDRIKTKSGRDELIALMPDVEPRAACVIRADLFQRLYEIPYFSSIANRLAAKIICTGVHRRGEMRVISAARCKEIIEQEAVEKLANRDLVNDGDSIMVT